MIYIILNNDTSMIGDQVTKHLTKLIDDNDNDNDDIYNNTLY